MRGGTGPLSLGEIGFLLLIAAAPLLLNAPRPSLLGGAGLLLLSEDGHFLLCGSVPFLLGGAATFCLDKTRYFLLIGTRCLFPGRSSSFLLVGARDILLEGTVSFLSDGTSCGIPDVIVSFSTGRLGSGLFTRTQRMWAAEIFCPELRGETAAPLGLKAGVFCGTSPPVEG